MANLDPPVGKHVDKLVRDEHVPRTIVDVERHSGECEARNRVNRRGVQHPDSVEHDGTGTRARRVDVNRRGKFEHKWVSGRLRNPAIDIRRRHARTSLLDEKARGVTIERPELDDLADLGQTCNQRVGRGRLWAHRRNDRNRETEFLEHRERVVVTPMQIIDHDDRARMPRDIAATMSAGSPTVGRSATACRSGRYGTSRSTRTPRPTTSERSALAIACRTTVVLPIPASPRTRHGWPAATAPRTIAIGCSRPNTLVLRVATAPRVLPEGTPPALPDGGEQFRCRSRLRQLMDVVGALANADPDDKRAVYDLLGVNLTYHRDGRVHVTAGADVLRDGVGGLFGTPTTRLAPLRRWCDLA